MKFLLCNPLLMSIEVLLSLLRIQRFASASLPMSCIIEIQFLFFYFFLFDVIHQIIKLSMQSCINTKLDIITKLYLYEVRGVLEFVAKLEIALDRKDLKVDITA